MVWGKVYMNEGCGSECLVGKRSGKKRSESEE